MSSCKGCQYKDCPYTRYINRCPCPLCIVKTMCDSPCQPFLDFRREHEQMHRKQLQETWI